MSLRQWLLLWLMVFSSRAPQHGRGAASKSEDLRESDFVEVIEMADDSSEIVKEGAEAVSFSNVKSVAEQGAIYSNMSLGNAVSHQQAMQQIQLAAVSKCVELIVGTSPSEGGADVAALQQLLKGAQTTPPVTP